MNEMWRLDWFLSILYRNKVSANVTSDSYCVLMDSSSFYLDVLLDEWMEECVTVSKHWNAYKDYWIGSLYEYCPFLPYINRPAILQEVRPKAVGNNVKAKTKTI